MDQEQLIFVVTKLDHLLVEWYLAENFATYDHVEQITKALIVENDRILRHE